MNFAAQRRVVAHGTDPVVIIDDFLSTKNVYEELSWLISLQCNRLIVTTRYARAEEIIRRQLSSQGYSVTGIEVTGFDRHTFVNTLLDLWQDDPPPSNLLEEIFQHTGGMPIAIPIVFNLLVDRGRYLPKASLETQSGGLNLDQLVRLFREALVTDNPAAHDVLLCLSNIAAIGMSAPAIASATKLDEAKVMSTLHELINTGLVRKVTNSDAAVKVHDVVAKGFLARAHEADIVAEMLLAHCFYWTNDGSDRSPITLIDSLLVSSKAMFSQTQSKGAVVHPYEAHRVMSEICGILEELSGLAANDESVMSTGDWLSSYVRDHYESMECYTVIPLALLSTKLPPREDIGDAFALFWESGDFVDPTIIGSALLASSHHLGLNGAIRIKMSFERQKLGAMDSPEIVVAAFASALTRFGLEEYAFALVTGYQVVGAGISCDDALTAMLLAIESTKDVLRLDRFLDGHGYRCRAIDPISATYLRKHARGVSVERYGSSIETNLNRVCFVAAISGNEQCTWFVSNLLHKAERISETPPLHRVHFSLL